MLREGKKKKDSAVISVVLYLWLFVSYMHWGYFLHHPEKQLGVLVRTRASGLAGLCANPNHITNQVTSRSFTFLIRQVKKIHPCHNSTAFDTQSGQNNDWLLLPHRDTDDHLGTLTDKHCGRCWTKVTVIL